MITMKAVESRNIFNIYVNARRNLLIAVGSTRITSSFLTKLNQETDEVDIHNPNFDFDLIANRLAVVNAAWTKINNNPLITTEAIMGPGVMDDIRTNTAIEEHRATYLRTSIDIEGRKRLLGFSARGAIVLINPNQPMTDIEQLNLIYITYTWVTTATHH